MGARLRDTLHSFPACPGHYMHFDTSVLGARGSRALLESPPLPAATDCCLRFWYHMDIPEHLCEHCGGGEEVPSLGLMYGSWGLSPLHPWTMDTASAPAGQWPFHSLWVLPSPVEPGMAGRARWLLWARVVSGCLCPLLAGSGELRVTLRGAAGQRTVWSVAGHRSRGWQGAVVPVQSPSEFQVSGATLRCRFPLGVHQSPQNPPSPADQF